MADMIKVRSTTDITISLYDPTIPINKAWEKRNAIIPIEKDKLTQLYFNTSLEKLMRQGLLVIDDRDFLYEVGFIAERDEEIPVIELTPNLMKRCISVMPLPELKETLAKMSTLQVGELAEYAIEHYNELKMDRIDILSEVSDKNILKAIEMYKKDQED